MGLRISLSLWFSGAADLMLLVLQDTSVISLLVSLKCLISHVDTYFTLFSFLKLYLAPTTISTYTLVISKMSERKKRYSLCFLHTTNIT